MPVTRAPYGSWPSPITAKDLAAAGHPVEGGRFVGDDVWWAELRPSEGGRMAIRRTGLDGAPEDILPPPWNARTRVHEYGGGAWTSIGTGRLVFAEYSDQRVYLLRGATPWPLTPEPPRPGAWRYADLQAVGREVWAVRERHDESGAVTRDICAIPLDGSAADDASKVRSVVGGSDFLAYPRVSPDGRSLAWIAWDHPRMPWDGTELRVVPLADGVASGEPVTLLGGPEESVLQPQWTGFTDLYVVSDRTGWWNLYRVPVAGGEPTPLHPLAADFGGPLWNLGSKWYLPVEQGEIVAVHTLGTDTLSVLDTKDGSLSDLDLGAFTSLALCDERDDVVLLRTAGARAAAGLRTYNRASGEITTVRLSSDELPAPEFRPDAVQLTFDGNGRDVHAIAYPPLNPSYEGMEGEKPPYVAFVHGGPTAHVAPVLSPVFAFFTSRGIGVIDVNYGGSTGYGREYRNRLRGQWGVVDVEDVVTAVLGLAEQGLADRDRLAIEGGSAGGWTVLSALTTSDVFACGASYYGVAELEKFVEETHDFESRYIDGLIGPLPEAADLYRERAPLENVDGLNCPVLLLQGLDDPIVPPAQAERFRDALVAKGIPHAYLAFPGESHGFRRVDSQIRARNAELSFYGQVLGFEPPGIPVLELWRPERS
ncbi:prolyl oligopeptidase family serine peptidase [Rhodococcus sp. HNM0569]|uniref:dipeptidyl-peptidase 5 n=1 Tax=Rhodococcus sp. HNM0569 TaxID=2716340 RepID=UPI00146A13CD|nr:prolyl oligopeptidase family serine peptidase [Rhodococcus sp. HNM0569]NLU83294.1 S9 family peptidase [Rhodococcus sp. HNM0569]